MSDPAGEWFADIEITLTVKTPCYQHGGFHCRKTEGGEHTLHCVQCHDAAVTSTTFRTNDDGTVSYR